jgi:hypothetical protein
MGLALSIMFTYLFTAIRPFQNPDESSLGVLLSNSLSLFFISALVISLGDDSEPSPIHGALLVVVMILGPLFILLMLIRGNFKMILVALQFLGLKKKKNAGSQDAEQETEDMVTSNDATMSIEEGHGGNAEMQTSGESPNQKPAATGVVEKVAPFPSKSQQLQKQPGVGFEKDNASDNRTHARNRAKSLDEDPMFLSSEDPQAAQSLPEFVSLKSLDEPDFVSLDSFDEEMRHIQGTSLDERSGSKPRSTPKRVDSSSERPKFSSSTPLGAPGSRTSSINSKAASIDAPVGIELTQQPASEDQQLGGGGGAAFALTRAGTTVLSVEPAIEIASAAPQQNPSKEEEMVSASEAAAAVKAEEEMVVVEAAAAADDLRLDNGGGHEDNRAAGNFDGSKIKRNSKDISGGGEGGGVGNSGAGSAWSKQSGKNVSDDGGGGELGGGDGVKETGFGSAWSPESENRSKVVFDAGKEIDYEKEREAALRKQQVGGRACLPLFNECVFIVFFCKRLPSLPPPPTHNTQHRPLNQSSSP